VTFPQDQEAEDAEFRAGSSAPAGGEPLASDRDGPVDGVQAASAESVTPEAQAASGTAAPEVAEPAVEVETETVEAREAVAGEGGAEDAEPHVEAWTPDPAKLLSAILFASQEYLGIRALKEILGEDFDAGRIRRLVKEINAGLRESDMPFEVVEVDATFRVRTLPKYFPWVRKLFKDANPRRLSQASLETLAIIAYKQPITKAEIEAIRGVNTDGCMKSLMDKKLVDVNGRSDAVGSAFTYSTTREFMRYFGINRVPDDLPRLSEFEAIVNAQALIPQVGADGNLVEMAQPEPDGEQLSMGQLE
jgi:segregation and condensation protein B